MNQYHIFWSCPLVVWTCICSSGSILWFKLLVTDCSSKVEMDVETEFLGPFNGDEMHSICASEKCTLSFSTGVDISNSYVSRCGNGPAEMQSEYVTSWWAALLPWASSQSIQSQSCQSWNISCGHIYIHMVREKFTLKQAMKAQRESTGITLLFC